MRFRDEPSRAIMQFNDYYAWMDDSYNVTEYRAARALLDEQGYKQLVCLL